MARIPANRITYSEGFGSLIPIDANARRGEKTPFAPAQKNRYAQRSAVERANSALKDRYGARFVRVRGAAKVMAHLMFGVIALTAAQLPVKHWHEIIADPTLGDAILDRLVHNAYTIELKGESMRKQKAKELNPTPDTSHNK